MDKLSALHFEGTYMTDNNPQQTIIDALERVEHPAIATTLLHLGILRDHVAADDLTVKLTLMLPFPSIPDNIRNYMVQSLAAAAQSAGGRLVEVQQGLMNDEERQKFLTIEQQNWRG
jgi:metal-sulfur cluster biosynthetic enzyme